MRRLPRLLFASTLILGFAFAPGCKKTGASTTTNAAGKPAKPPRKAGMPKPYRLPAKPELAAFVAAPAEAIAASRSYGQGLLPQPRTLIAKAIADAPTDFDRKLAALVDTGRPWAAVRTEGQNILWLPIVPAKKAQLTALLTPKPPEGKFGAVNLQRPGAGAKLAWLDGQSDYLALADDLRGISTARNLPHEYGKQGLFVTVTAEQARRLTGQAPFSRVELKGAGAHDFTLVSEDTDTSLAPELSKLTAGALTGMLDAEQVALGVSSKYADYSGWVKKVLSDTKRTVDRQNFLVRGNLENLHRRLGSMLRQWDGRVAVGVGPKRHLLLGFGAKDTAKMGGATHHMLDGVRDNVSTARSLGISIPKVRFQKKKTTVAGSNIAVVALEGAKKVVPRELWPLIGEDRGDLRIAMAFPKRAGGAMIVVGPSADKVLGTWLEQTQRATPGSDTTGDFAAATFAVDPQTMATLGSGDIRAVAAKLMSLSADRAPTKVVVRRDEARYEVKVKGPKLEPAAPTRATTAVSRRRATPGRTAPTRAGAPRKTSSKGKPTRSGGKPIRG